MVDPENTELVSSPVIAVLPSNPPWAEPYLEYLTNKKLLEDEVQKRQIEHRAKVYTIIDRHLSRITLLMDTKTRPNLAISPTCHHQSTRRLKSHRKELSYAIMMASEEGVVTLAGETTSHNVKPAGMADPSIGNHLAMTMACIAIATRISIALHATAMTKGKAPAAMTMIQLHEE
jgi:hypothetical protein